MAVSDGQDHGPVPVELLERPGVPRALSIHAPEEGRKVQEAERARAQIAVTSQAMRRRAIGYTNGHPA